MTPRARVLACAALLLALPLFIAHADPGAASAPAPAGSTAELPALSADERALLAAIPDEHTPESKRHYFRSNEWFHSLLKDVLQNRGGAYVGVGSDQNYTMAALARSELMLLIDFDARIPWVHRIYGVLISASATPDELVARFAPEQLEASMQLLREGLAGDPQAVTIARHFAKLNTRWFRYVERVRRLEVSWLGDPALYAHVRNLFRAGRVVSRNGDLTGTATLRAIADAAIKLHTPVRIVYFSNAEQFFKYGKTFRESMELLPTDEHSVVVRTVHHWRLQTAKPNDYTEWHYMVQDFPDFKARMDAGYRSSFRLVRDVAVHRAESASGDSLSLLTAKVPIHAGP
jgi:hypothetical protein